VAFHLRSYRRRRFDVADRNHRPNHIDTIAGSIDRQHAQAAEVYLGSAIESVYEEDLQKVVDYKARLKFYPQMVVNPVVA
jgi:RecJ-like exonuclease